MGLGGFDQPSLNENFPCVRALYLDRPFSLQKVQNQLLRATPFSFVHLQYFVSLGNLVCFYLFAKGILRLQSHSFYANETGPDLQTAFDLFIF